MFTGIVRAQGQIVRSDRRGQGVELEVTDVPGAWSAAVGDSIAVDGVCLTVERLLPSGVVFYVSQETLACTTADEWQVGRGVHLEPALRAGDRLDGHVVQGHVDAVGRLRDKRSIGEDAVVSFEFPAAVAAMIFDKGSIAVDGVSLTINRVIADCFEVNLIPHTQRETHLAKLEPGRRVNLETDPIARQVAAVVGRMKLAG